MRVSTLLSRSRWDARAEARARWKRREAHAAIPRRSEGAAPPYTGRVTQRHDGGASIPTSAHPFAGSPSRDVFEQKVAGSLELTLDTLVGYSEAQGVA